MKRLFTIISACILIAACATSGRPISNDQLSSVQEGVTTRSEVVAMFGPPLATTRNSDGTEILSWGYSKVGFAGSSVESQGLSVVIGPDGTVTTYSVTGFKQ
tara:strand:+ start:3112 stop:3417 length:306 start_codon:yes stop_codon:yes gene_type:complete